MQKKIIFNLFVFFFFCETWEKSVERRFPSKNQIYFLEFAAWRKCGKKISQNKFVVVVVILASGWHLFALSKKQRNKQPENAKSKRKYRMHVGKFRKMKMPRKVDTLSSQSHSRSCLCKRVQATSVLSDITNQLNSTNFNETRSNENRVLPKINYT